MEQKKQTDEALSKERTDKGVRVDGLPRFYSRVVLQDYLKTFGDIVEEVEPKNRKKRCAFYRFREKESADKMKLTPNHVLSFGKITVGEWFKIPPPKASPPCPPESFDTNLTFDQQLSDLLNKLTPGEESTLKHDQLRNSQLIKYYMDLDGRIKSYLLLIKYWAKYFEVMGPTPQISSYSTTLMALFYLQQLESPLIPTVGHLKSMCKEKQYINDWQCNFFASDWKAKPASDSMTVYDLVRGFFDYYSSFDFANYVICPLVGRPVAKSDFLDSKLLPSEMAAIMTTRRKNVVNKFGNGVCVCIQDPFVLNNNVTHFLKLGDLQISLMPNLKRTLQVFCQTTDQTQLLTALFGESSREILSELSDIHMALTLKFLPKNINGMTTEVVGDKIDSWLKDSYKFVMFLMKELCGLDVRVTHSGDQEGDNARPSKMRKLENETDAPVSKFDSPVTLQCFGCYDIMDMRSDVRKTLAAMTPLKREQLVTKQLVAKLKLEETTMCTIEFTCRFIPTMEPPLITLEIKNLGSDPKKFEKWCNFLSFQLYRWFYSHFMEYRQNFMNQVSSTSDDNMLPPWQGP